MNRTRSRDGSAINVRRNYYTDAKLEIARRNVEKYPWARQLRDEILARADKWAGYDDARLRTLVVPPQVPRGYDIHSFGCPVHGEKVYETGFYKWIIDFDRPYKIKCPVGCEEYPSNDFAAYLATAMQDRSLLAGPYADDGWGWTRPGEEGKPKHWFVAYYAFWSAMNLLRPAIADLSQAALLADDPAAARRYAHKCAVLLWQLAEYYPDYDYRKQSREAREHNPEYTGKINDMIMETRTPNVAGPAYDAIRPFLCGDAELGQLAGKSADEIDRTIRERLLREAARCIVDGSGRIRGNYGMHQKSALILARALNDNTVFPTSAELIRYAVDNPSPATPSDIGLWDALENLVYRDGLPHESIGYNLVWVSQLVDIADELAELGINAFERPRMRRLLAWPFDVCVAGRFMPPMADSGDMLAAPSFNYMETPVYLRSIPHVRDPRILRALADAGQAGRDPFRTPVEEVMAEDKAEMPYGVKTKLFPAYGLANLQSGGQTPAGSGGDAASPGPPSVPRGGEGRRESGGDAAFAGPADRQCSGGDAASTTAASLFYGWHLHHMHHDQLNLLIFSHGNPLLTDIGYPEQTDAFNHKRFGWFNNTIAHNTVTVDAAKQVRYRDPGLLHGFLAGGFAQFVDASCEGAYPGKVSTYRRANMLVEADADHAYVFDVFHVRGGAQHDYAAHGPQAEFFCDAPLGPPQETGTLAGADVPPEHFHDDPGLKDKPLGTVSYLDYFGSGFQYLTNVRRAPLNSPAICDWRLTEPLPGQPERPWKGIGLRAHLIGQGEELIVCEGPVQHYKHLPKSRTCFIRRRMGRELASTFVTVYEPYKDRPWIRRVSPIAVEPNDGQAAAALVELADGAKHLLFHSLNPGGTCVLDGRVRVAGQAACLVLDPDGRPVKAMLFGGTLLAMDGFRLEGLGILRSRIRHVDYAAGILEIADPILPDDLKDGQVVLVRGPGFADSITLRRVVDATHFSIGDEDLCVAGGPVAGVRGKELLSRVPNPHARVGMTVLNARMAPQGRLARPTENGWLLDRPAPLSEADFPALAGQSAPRYAVVVAGEGDELLIPHRAVWGRPCAP